MLPLSQMVRDDARVRNIAEANRLIQELPDELKYKGPVPAQGKIDYPSTDRRSGNFSGTPNMQFVAPNMKGQMRADAEEFYAGLFDPGIPGMGMGNRIASSVAKMGRPLNRYLPTRYGTQRADDMRSMRNAPDIDPDKQRELLMRDMEERLANDREEALRQMGYDKAPEYYARMAEEIEANMNRSIDLPESQLTRLTREMDDYTQQLIDYVYAQHRHSVYSKPGKFTTPEPVFSSAEFPNMTYEDFSEKLQSLRQDKRNALRDIQRARIQDMEQEAIRSRPIPSRERPIQYPTFGKPVVRNKSGYTKDELLQVAKNKDALQSMDDDAIRNSVLKPNGEVVPYNTESLEPYFSGKNNVNMIPVEEYTSRINDNIQRLNTIIAGKNTSGVDYRAIRLDPRGVLEFEAPSMPGKTAWSVGINPGEWHGNVEDVVDASYLKNVPGLQMRGTTGTVFPDGITRKGTRAYESINEYLKELGLGRVSSGFNSQTRSSEGVWDHLINSDRAVGYKANKGLTYGTMKTGLGAAAGIETYRRTQEQE
jgi:hypothetical protein